MMAGQESDATDERREDIGSALKAMGIQISEAERLRVQSVADWLGTGITSLSRVFPAAGVSSGNPADLSIPEAGSRLREGSLSSLDLTRAVLGRIAERDGAYLSFYEVAGESALDAARRADAELGSGKDRGPLHGIPIGVKDMIDVAGLPTTAGSRGRAGMVATQNAAVVDRLLEGGAVIIGKLATYEWGTVGPAWDTLHPPARNPWNANHITGGSSSGCAVAVAGGLLRTSIGTDTGGSVRGPASYCGVVGLKPTRGLVPTGGSLGMSPSMDHVGPMSASSLEAALTLDVLTGKFGEDSATHAIGESIGGMRLGYAREWFARDPQTHPAVLDAMDAAMSTYSELGAIVEQIDLPDYAAVEVAAAAVLLSENLKYHAPELAKHPDHFGRRTFESIIAGAAVTPSDYEDATRAGDAFRKHLDLRVFSKFDAVLTVCTLTPALPLSAFADKAAWTPMRTIGFNLSGHPVLALPMGFSSGLPLGMQIIGPWLAEARICQLGDAFERATDFSLQRPAPPAR